MLLDDFIIRTSSLIESTDSLIRLADSTAALGSAYPNAICPRLLCICSLAPRRSPEIGIQLAGNAQRTLDA